MATSRLAASRATWRERVFGFLGLVASAAITITLAHPTMRGAATTYFTLPMGFLLFALTACTNQYQEKVVGTWETDMPFNPKFVLAKDGTGTMSVSANGQTVTKTLTWRLNRSNLIFTLDGKDMGGVIKSIDDKKMVLNDPDVKKDTTWTRK